MDPIQGSSGACSPVHTAKPLFMLDQSVQGWPGLFSSFVSYCTMISNSGKGRGYYSQMPWDSYSKCSTHSYDNTSALGASKLTALANFFCF